MRIHHPKGVVLGYLVALCATTLVDHTLAQSAPHEIFKLHGLNNGDRFGFSVGGAGDVDNDGFDDVIVGSLPGSTGGYVQVFSGRDARVLLHITGGREFGLVCDGAGDVDADGHDDVIVGQFGTAYVFSGKDGKLLHRFDRLNLLDTLGRSVSGAGDVNKDGYADSLALETHVQSQTGGVRVYSGRDGQQLAIYRNYSCCFNFGMSFDGVGDVDGDGKDDVLVGSPASTRTQKGQVYLYSPKSLFLESETTPNAVLLPTAGVLDAAGKAETKLVLPTGGSPSLIGRVLHHAYVVFDLQKLTFDFASNPVPVTFVK